MTTTTHTETVLVVDPRDPDPDSTTEMTLDEFAAAGGDMGRLRDEAGSAGDFGLIELIDAWHARI